MARLSVGLSVFLMLHLFLPVGEQCPSMQVEDWKFPQTARHNITGTVCLVMDFL